MVTGTPLHLFYDFFLAELLQPSIPVFVSTIYAVLTNNSGAVIKFILDLVALLRRMNCVFGDEDLSRQVICASERSSPVFSSTFYSVSSKIVDVVVKVGVCLTSESRMCVPRCNTLQMTVSATTLLHISPPRKRELHRVFPRPCPRIPVNGVETSVRDGRGLNMTLGAHSFALPLRFAFVAQELIVCNVWQALLSTHYLHVHTCHACSDLVSPSGQALLLAFLGVFLCAILLCVHVVFVLLRYFDR